MMIFWLTCLVGYPRTSAPEPENLDAIYDIANNKNIVVNRIINEVFIPKLTQLLRFILVFLANQRFVFLICFTVFYKF